MNCEKVVWKARAWCVDSVCGEGGRRHVHVRQNVRKATAPFDDHNRRQRDKIKYGTL